MDSIPIDVQPQRVLDLILQSLEELLNFELAVILKLDENEQLKVEKAVGSLVNDSLKTFTIDLRKRRDLADILSHSSPYLYSTDVPHVDTYDEILDLPDSHSCMVVPLYIKENLIGMMTLDNRVCGAFSPGIVSFVGTISRLIAVIMAQSDTSKLLISQKNNLTAERNFLLRSDREKFRNMLGNSPRWQSVIEQVRTVAASDLPVLIQGETGTGKEMVARTIHDLSTRSDRPFITLNCSALNASIAESELFGHEKGAFTSAVLKRKGRFDLADGGTLFLDEIADLPAEIQPKILRTLQEGTFERLGGEKTLKTDVRIIAASNKDLRNQVSTGLFREDLYYRLGVFPIFLPPLRDRDDDVIILAQTFLEQLEKKNNYSLHSLTTEAIKSLINYSWPGNVRELQNIIRRSALVSSDGIIDSSHLSLPENNGPETDRVNRRTFEKDSSGEFSFQTLDEVISQHIQSALERSEGKIYGIKGAAELLGMKPTTLQSRIKKLAIK